MFKTKNNLRRNAKHKQQKSTKKSYPYEEDYNEVILNDLMKEDNENKVDNKEEPARKTKKRKRINLNLGTKKKSTSNNKEEKDQPKEIIEVDSKNNSPEIEESNQKPTPKNKKSNKPKRENKHSKKMSKHKSNNNEQEESTKSSKKLNKSKKKDNQIKEEKSKRPSKKSKKEEIKTKSIEEEQVEVEYINDNIENGEQEIIEGSIFRNMEEETLVNEEEKESEHKIENIIWSDNKFPKV